MNNYYNMNSIIDKYKLRVTYDHQGEYINQYGLGDILLMYIRQKNNKTGLIYFNLLYFDKSKCDYFDNPFSCLEFRINLINTLNMNIRYVLTSDFKNQKAILRNMSDIEDIKLFDEFSDIIKNPKYNYEYLVIHTKIRLVNKKNYECIKNNILDLFKNIKFKYPVIILGERVYTDSKYVNLLDVQTIYEECMCLEKNNIILDLTRDNITIDYNYDSFLQDINIIHNAFCNINIGIGGHFCICLALSNHHIAYIDEDFSGYFNKKSLVNNNLLYDYSGFVKEVYKYASVE